MKLGKKAKWLAKHGYQVVLVDKNAYHTYTPTLYEVATTSKETANYLDLKRVSTHPIAELLSGYNIQFRQEVVKNIDSRKAEVEFVNGSSISYSHLIFALGAKTNYFGIEGIEKKSLTLKSFTDALEIRDTILDKIYSTKYNHQLSIVICGAGPTGVELAAEFKEWFSELKREGTPCDIKITLLDAAPTILAKFDKEVIRKAEKRLKKFGVDILTKSLVEKLTRDKITLKGDIRFRYDILIWAGGIEANALTQVLPFPKSGRGIETDKTLEARPINNKVKLGGRVYVIGDSAALKSNRNRSFVPQMARPAISEGTIAAENIVRDIAGKPKKNFCPMDYPYVIPVGGKYAIVKIGSLVVSGFIGWIFKGLIELGYLISIMPLGRALKIWYGGLIMFIKNDRLG